MSRRFFVPLVLILTINGWTSSRFFIQLNGTSVGSLIETRQVDRQAGIIKIRSVSRISLSRGGTTVKLSETVVEVSRLNGVPVSLSVQGDLAGLKINLRAEFSGGSVLVFRDGKRWKMKISSDTVLSYGSERYVAAFLKSGKDSVTFPVFSPDTMEISSRTVRRLTGKKPDKHGGERDIRIQVTDVSKGVSLVQEMRVNRKGVPSYVKSRMMGLTIEYVSARGTGAKPAEGREKTDILIQTLFRAKQWFSSGFDVNSLMLKVTAGDILPSIPNEDFQQVKKQRNSLIVTVTRADLTGKMKRDAVPSALKSGPIVQPDLPEILRICGKLRKNSENDAEFVCNVVHRVYRMIEKKGYGVGFADTAAILKTREGDCTEHTVLAMAILRAGGIPCRAAAGVVAVNGTIGYHMWPQVAMGGKWISIDPTFDEETADPSHIIMAVSFLNDTGFQRDLLPIVQQLGALSIEPVSAVFRNGKAVSRFGVHREGHVLVVEGCGCRLNPGEAFQWEPEPAGRGTDCFRMGTMKLKDGMTLSVALSDGKSRRKLTLQAESLLADFEPLSMETILGHPVILGENGRRIGMVAAFGATLFRFTFSAPSATMEAELKEKAYNICLKLLANVKRTDSDCR